MVLFEKSLPLTLLYATPTNKNIYMLAPPAPEDLPGGRYVARSVSPSKHLAFGYNPSVCSIISHATVVFALLTSRSQSQPNIYDNCNSYDIISSICICTVLALI